MDVAAGHWRRFDHRSGLTHDSRCVLADRDGRVWIGSRRRGLSCYDGYSFEAFTTDDGLASNYVRCLLQTRSGDLWVGSESGLSKYDDGRFTTPEWAPGDSSIRSLLEGSDGSLWIGGKAGLSRYRDGSRRPCLPADAGGGPDVRALAEGCAGTVWVGTDRGLYVVRDGSLADPPRDVRLPTDDITSLCAAGDGSLWIGTYGAGLCRYDGDGVQVYTREHGLPGDHIRCLHEDRRGHLWIGTVHAGACRYDGVEFAPFSTADGLAHNFVHDIAEDREGAIWLACWHGGVSCFLAGVSRVCEDPVEEVMALDAEGRLWWGSGPAVAWGDDRATQRMEFGSRIACLLPDSRGRLWVGTSDSGVFVCEDRSDILGARPGRAFARLGDEFREAQDIHEAADGAIWVATTHGVLRHDERGSVAFTSEDGLAADDISTICEDGAGAMWFGSYNGGGLTRYDGERFETRTTADGLAHDEVLHLTRGPDNRLWAATRGGVSCLDGTRFTNLTTEDGLPADAVKYVLVDSRGRLWGATLGAGVFQFDGENVQTLTDEDGLPSNYCPGIVEAPDGSILIATLRGIGRYHPGPPFPPSVRVVGVDTHEWQVSPASVTTQAGFGRIRVVYRGVSLMTTNMRYAYMLVGADDAWTSTWSEEVVYADLPPGDYVLKIKAYNRDLVESTSPAELAIRVVPDPREAAVAELGRVIGERTEQLARAETEIQRQGELLRQIVREARCILWHSHVEGIGDLFHWTPLRPATPEFDDFLPLNLLPGEDYHTAWERSVFPEDRAVMDRSGNDAIRDGLPGYAHDYRCIDRDGEVRWMHEDATIRRLGESRWTVTGVVTDITRLKEAERDQLALKERESAGASLRKSEQERSRLIVQMMTVQENERARIARDLHDHAGQALSSLLVGLRVLSRTGDVREVRRQAETLREVATQTFSQVRELSFDVYPSALEHLGLVAALQQDAARFHTRHGITVDVHAEGEPGGCPRPVKAALYQVVHAALTNIAQHADARNVGIVVQQHDDRLSVIVEDDGAGFDVDAVLSGPVERRFGLLAMQERMLSIDGKGSFESTPGDGASLFIEAQVAPGEGAGS